MTEVYCKYANAKACPGDWISFNTQVSIKIVRVDYIVEHVRSVRIYTSDGVVDPDSVLEVRPATVACRRPHFTDFPSGRDIESKASEYSAGRSSQQGFCDGATWAIQKIKDSSKGE